MNVEESAQGVPELLTVDEVAEKLKVPKKTVYAEREAWGIQAYKIGRHLRFRASEVREWLAGRAI